MRPEKLAVDAEIDVREVALLEGESRVKRVIDIVRTKADQVAREKGATVRTDRRPLLQISKGSHVLTGVDMLLVHSVWDVEVPDRAVLPSPEVVL